MRVINTHVFTFHSTGEIHQSEPGSVAEIFNCTVTGFNLGKTMNCKSQVLLGKSRRDMQLQWDSSIISTFQYMYNIHCILLSHGKGGYLLYWTCANNSCNGPEFAIKRQYNRMRLGTRYQQVKQWAQGSRSSVEQVRLLQYTVPVDWSLLQQPNKGRILGCFSTLQSSAITRIRLTQQAKQQRAQPKCCIAIIFKLSSCNLCQWAITSSWQQTNPKKQTRKLGMENPGNCTTAWSRKDSIQRKKSPV